MACTGGRRCNELLSPDGSLLAPALCDRWNFLRPIMVLCFCCWYSRITWCTLPKRFNIFKFLALLAKRIVSTKTNCVIIYVLLTFIKQLRRLTTTVCLQIIIKKLFSILIARYSADFGHCQVSDSVNSRENADFSCLSCSIILLI